MDDPISRQAAIGIIQSLYPGIPRVPWLRKDWQKRYEPYINAEKAIRTLPSAQPEQKWIPCSERLPESKPEDLEYPTVIACCEDGEVMTACYYESTKEWGIGEYYDRKINPVAWMPLPSPDREDSGE